MCLVMYYQKGYSKILLGFQLWSLVPILQAQNQLSYVHAGKDTVYLILKMEEIEKMEKQNIFKKTS